MYFSYFLPSQFKEYSHSLRSVYYNRVFVDEVQDKQGLKALVVMSNKPSDVRLLLGCSSEQKLHKIFNSKPRLMSLVVPKHGHGFLLILNHSREGINSSRQVYRIDKAITWPR